MTWNTLPMNIACCRVPIKTKLLLNNGCDAVRVARTTSHLVEMVVKTLHTAQSSVSRHEFGLGCMVAYK